MGIVSINCSEIGNIDTLYKEADDLLYTSKENGRNKVSIR